MLDTRVQYIYGSQGIVFSPVSSYQEPAKYVITSRVEWLLLSDLYSIKATILREQTSYFQGCMMLHHADLLLICSVTICVEKLPYICIMATMESTCMTTSVPIPYILCLLKGFDNSLDYSDT